MAKYKFRLSYKENNELVPICLNSIEGLDKENITDIKEIDRFTTRYESIESLLIDLKNRDLIPFYVDNLFITFDKKIGKEIVQQLYSFSKTIFYRKDSDKLSLSHACSLIRDHINDGIFMQNIVRYYSNKYPNKNFNILYGVSYNLLKYNSTYLSPSEYTEYINEVEYFMDYIFYKKNKDEKKEKDYRKIRDFFCYLGGEKPIKIKKSEVKKIIENKNVEEIVRDENEEFITYKEYQNYNKQIVMGEYLEDFEPFRDGNDWIAPVTKKEIYSSLNGNCKKLCKRRDNGEYE